MREILITHCFIPVSRVVVLAILSFTLTKNLASKENCAKIFKNI